MIPEVSDQSACLLLKLIIFLPVCVPKFDLTVASTLDTGSFQAALSTDSNPEPKINWTSHFVFGQSSHLFSRFGTLEFRHIILLHNRPAFFFRLNRSV